MIITRTLILALLLAASLSVHAEENRPNTPRAVLVTGASTGIGRKTVEYLASAGYFVYAGARKDADLEALSSIRNVRGVRLDVTSEEDISAALRSITREGRGLYGLINNAGVITAGSVVDTSPREFDLVMAVNVTGPFRVTQAFLPLVISEKGRIVTIGSVAGFAACPGASVYCMSKHAIEAFTDALAAEMEPLGVKVSVVEPGQYKSEIWRSAVARGNVNRRMGENFKLRQKEPDEVATAVLLSLSEEAPKRRYLVVPHESEARSVIEFQFVRLVQTNEGQVYTYDRAALIELLDAALAHSRPRVKR